METVHTVPIVRAVTPRVPRVRLPGASPEQVRLLSLSTRLSEAMATSLFGQRVLRLPTKAQLDKAMLGGRLLASDLLTRGAVPVVEGRAQKPVGAVKNVPLDYVYGSAVGPMAGEFSRLRKRGRATKQLERVLSGVVVKSSSGSSSVSEFLRETLPEATRVMGITQVKTSGEEGAQFESTLAVLRTRTGEVRVCVDLAARLATVASLKTRSSSLLRTLCARAMVWCDERGFSSLDTASFLAGSVALAFRVRRSELVATDLLATRVAGMDYDTMKSLGEGRPRLGSLTSSELWSRVFRFWEDPLRKQFAASFPTS